VVGEQLQIDEAVVVEVKVVWGVPQAELGRGVGSMQVFVALRPSKLHSYYGEWL
jgi:hypothetical protein